jgi:hypothetical protein
MLIGDSYIAVLQVNIICSPPGEVSAGVQGQVFWARGLAGPRGHGSGHWTLHGQPTEPVLTHLTTLILLFLSYSHYRTHVDNGNAVITSGG